MSASAPTKGAARVHVDLLLGISASPRTETCVGLAVELGVDRIQPFVGALCRVPPSKQFECDEVEELLEGTSATTARRLGRADVPIGRPCTLAEALDLALQPSDGAEDVSDPCVIACWEQSPTQALSLPAALRARSGARGRTVSSLVLIVGGEDGLSADEVDLIRSRGGMIVTLGHLTLDAEPATAAAVALAVSTLGGLGCDEQVSGTVEP